jgi:hypothetical protein
VLSQALHQYVGHRLDLIFMPFRASHPIRIIHSLIRIADIRLPSEAGNSMICMKKSANSSQSKIQSLPTLLRSLLEALVRVTTPLKASAVVRLLCVTAAGSAAVRGAVGLVPVVTDRGDAFKAVQGPLICGNCCHFCDFCSCSCGCWVLLLLLLLLLGAAAAAAA